MTTMIAEIYQALKEVGASEESARKAAESITAELVTKDFFRAELEPLRSELKLLKWMVGLILAGVVSLVLKSFFVP